ncbi:MAG: TIR domain-containing protein [Chloroflexi bacterium]|nr:MAG: TIR domain-containing protein [Chloroflexota bacterium]
MGRTYLHDGHERPDAVELNSGLRGKLERDTVYVLYGQDDEAIAEQLAADLDIVGMAVWLHRHDEQTVQWAGGVHPALVQCKRMVLVLTDRTFQDTTLPQTWQYFRQNRKPIVIAQMMGGVTPPDEIRRSPRYDFTGDYKRAFREMLQVLSS